MTITPDNYLDTCKRRYGSANPERMSEPVWEWMMRHRLTPYLARKELGLDQDYGCGPRNRNPDWCFLRMGMAKVTLADGRVLCIAGEHEDFYDPHFCIYNDVIVQRGDEVEIYGYPKEIFPPTDFHSATLVGDKLWLVGSIGYGEMRGPDTQVCTLDTSTYEIRKIACAGVSPGWLNDQRAMLRSDGTTIEVSGGVVERAISDGYAMVRNLDTYALDTRHLTWTKLTDTSTWRQFRLNFEQDIKDFMKERDLGWYTGEILSDLGHRVEPAPRREHSPDDPPCENDDERSEIHVHTVWVGDVAVRIDDWHTAALRVVIEGALPDAETRRLVEQLRVLLESTKRRVTRIDEL